MNEQKQVNEGYTIIESMTVGNARFVIGEKSEQSGSALCHMAGEHQK